MVEKTTDIEQHRDALRKKIFSSVAHDLKTPLVCIIGALQALDQMKNKLSSKQHDTLICMALKEAQRLDVLISDMLEKAKPE
jgi:K+-sensing histidine kinase KdpD